MKSLVMVRMTRSRPSVIIATAKSGSPIIGRMAMPLDDHADERRQRAPRPVAESDPLQRGSGATVEPPARDVQDDGEVHDEVGTERGDGAVGEVHDLGRLEDDDEAEGQTA